jgi:hypothetical protein
MMTISAAGKEQKFFGSFFQKRTASRARAASSTRAQAKPLA